MKRLIIGCGYLGQRVATYYQSVNQSVCGLVRTGASGSDLLKRGIAPLVQDLDEEPLPELSLAKLRIFYFLPPPGTGETDPRIERLGMASRGDSPPEKVVYLSTTGVYGDCDGALVDETRTAKPTALRARRRWDAEQKFRSWSRNDGFDLIILRVAGIYGPGRLPLERIKQRLPLVRSEEAPWTNRIHVDDLVQACTQAMEKGQNGEIYNVSDGAPGTMTDYFDQIADQANLPRPPRIALAQGDDLLSPGMMSYMRESRRLDNRKMLDELGVTLRYPDLASGLKNCFDHQSH
ncbi:MAG: SDR family oxidoreductase [Gammaproteobacteria bacterium]|nr:SDR family oxidoreductase [Gammaproteobacteria bacterium]